MAPLRFIFTSITLIVILFSTSLSAQSGAYPSPEQGVRKSGTSAIRQDIVQPFTARIMTRDGQISETNFLESRRVIVEFVETPWLMQKARLGKEAASETFFQDRFREFSRDLNKIYSKLPTQATEKLSGIKENRQLYKLFFGVSITVPRLMLTSIHNLPYVKRLHFDNEVKVSLEESVPLVGADQVWSTYGSQGEDVVVGILDTGIDYQHPDLGQGFGPAYKVIGGYDVINDDQDPWDDHGHGTHVAGIVAADGANLSGVAPNAKLMAFKVLDSYGFGFQSHIIAGIERAVDPNGDGNFDDRVDIANLSLGGTGDADDPQSQAVDNAVELGVTICISAGNNWTFKSIDSPGTARLPITVGATDKEDKIAFFSSRGPTKKNYLIKPEIVAPGFRINSTEPNNTYGQQSGTSMSTPHVAGVCALLKSLHPNWSPAQVKSALMSSAVDLDEEIMVQGAGRLDALNAVDADLFAEPSQLSFGLVEINQTSWVMHDTLVIYGSFSGARSYDISVEGLQAGISLDVGPASFTIDSLDTNRIAVTLTVDNNIVPYPVTGSLAYEGQIVISGTSNSIRIPWAFIKASQLSLTFDQPSPVVFLTNSFQSVNSFDDFNWLDPYTAEVNLAAGEYELVASSSSGENTLLIIRENVQIQGTETLNIEAAEAEYLISLKGVDINGSLLSEQGGYSSYALHLPESMQIPGIVMSFWQTPLYISRISDRYKMTNAELYVESRQPYKDLIYVLQHDLISGVQSNVEQINDPSNYFEAPLKLSPVPGASDGEIWLVTGIRQILNDLWVYYGLVTISNSSNSQWEGVLYHTSDKLEKLSYVAWIESKLPGNEMFVEPIGLVDDKIASYRGSRATPNIHRFDEGQELVFGKNPIFAAIEHSNNRNNEIGLRAFLDFLGPLGEYRNSDLSQTTYTLFDGQAPIISTDSVGLVVQYDLPAGCYRLEVENLAARLNNVQVKASISNSFDLALSDPNPPIFTSLKLLNSTNYPTQQLQPDEAGTLYFSAADFAHLIEEMNYLPVVNDSTRLFYKYHGEENWQALTTEVVIEDSAIGFLYRADVSDLTHRDSAAVDLRMTIKDPAGNRSEFRLEPAFAIGDFGVTSIEDEREETSLFPRRFHLYDNYPNPFNPATTIKYDLAKSGKVQLVIYNILGEKVRTLVNELQVAGANQSIWDGLDESGQPATSGVYVYRLKAPNFTAARKMLLIR